MADTVDKSKLIDGKSLDQILKLLKDYIASETKDIAKLRSDLDTILNGDTSKIDAWNEIEAFLDGVTDSETLAGLLLDLKNEIEEYINDSNFATSSDINELNESFSSEISSLSQEIESVSQENDAFLEEIEKRNVYMEETSEISKEDISDLVNYHRPYYPIGVYVKNGYLRIYGHEQLLAAGYVPYIFRYINKNNRIKHKDGKIINSRVNYKGWCIYGNEPAIIEDNIVKFGKPNFVGKKIKYDDPTSEPSGFVNCNFSEEKIWITHGRKRIIVHNNNIYLRTRSINLPYAIGFAKPKETKSQLITTADLVSNLAQFTVCCPTIKCEKDTENAYSNLRFYFGLQQIK